MQKLSESSVFEPINDLFDELQALLEKAERLELDQETINTNIKIFLMKAYQRGENKTLDTVGEWFK
ncbi:hypothetical protein [Citrobacter phage Tr1]|nr:hypothetical protein [Citrobacter phage Tr1]